MSRELERMAEILRGSQQQCDADGTMIAVSRQALDETLALIAALTASPQAAPSSYLIVNEEGTVVGYSLPHLKDDVTLREWERLVPQYAIPQAAPVRTDGSDWLDYAITPTEKAQRERHFAKASPQAAPEGGWLPMADAPKDGRRVLLRFKDAQALPQRGDGFGGVPFVGKWTGDLTAWCFAAPVGMGGFPDDWMAGWQPMPTASPQVQGGEAREAVAWRVPTPYGVGYNFADEATMQDMADWLAPTPQRAPGVSDATARDVLDRYLANAPSGDHWPPERQRELRVVAMRDAINNALEAALASGPSGAGLVLVDDSTGYEVELCPSHGTRWVHGCQRCMADLDALAAALAARTEGETP